MRRDKEGILKEKTDIGWLKDVFSVIFEQGISLKVETERS